MFFSNEKLNNEALKVLPLETHSILCEFNSPCLVVFTLGVSFRAIAFLALSDFSGGFLFWFLSSDGLQNVPADASAKMAKRTEKNNIHYPIDSELRKVKLLTKNCCFHHYKIITVNS